MVSGPNFNLELAFEAGLRGEPSPPEWLVSAFEQEEDDPNVLLARLKEAVRRGTGFLNSYKPGPIKPETAQGWSTLVQWLAHSVTHWTVDKDPKVMRLRADLLIGAACAVDRRFWRLVRQSLSPESRLADGLLAVIGGSGVSAEASPDTPIWEREHLASLRAADEAEDWVALNELLRAFDNHLRPEMTLKIAADALSELAPDRIAKAADRCADIFSAMILSASVSPAVALQAATTSGQRFQFSALRTVLSVWRGEPDDELERALSNALDNLAADRVIWPKAMATFNRYPVRYPALQGPLAVCLSRAPMEALIEYVDAIELTISSAEGGVLVARCLHRFAASAPDTHRLALWGRAYDRWRTWAFDVNQRQLTSIARAEIDFAVIGWLIEGDPAAADMELGQILTELETLEETWHASMTASKSRYYRLLSGLQIYAHAAGKPLPEAWLPDRCRYMPQTAKAEYSGARHQLNSGSWPPPRSR